MLGTQTAQVPSFFPTANTVHCVRSMVTAAPPSLPFFARRIVMPYVSIRVAGTLNKEQKEKISQGVTEVISREAGKPPESVLIFIDEVPHENIAKAGKLMQAPK
jgi:4-oxalocrotonate tautomerase